MRGCFGGCTFCSHHDAPGPRRSRAAASARSCARSSAWPRSPASRARSATSAARPPTCTRCAARAPTSRPKCRRLSCIHPTICKLLGTDHEPDDRPAARGARRPGRQARPRRLRHPHGPRQPDAEYLDELAPPPRRRAPEGRARARERARARAMKKPPQRDLRDVRGRSSAARAQRAGKEQYLVPYFIASHPGLDARGHDRAGGVPEEARLPPAPGAGLHPGADGHRHVHVPHGPRPADDEARRARQEAARPPDAARAHAVLRAAKLVRRAPGAARRRPARPDRQRAALPDPRGAAARGARARSAQEADEATYVHAEDAGTQATVGYRPGRKGAKRR